MAYTPDSANLFEKLRGLPDLCAEIFALARQFPVKISPDSIRQAMICGVGDGALAGEIFRNLTLASSTLPVSVCSARELPAFAGPQSLIVFISLSGREPELVDAYSQAADLHAATLVITGGTGHLRDMAEAQSLPCLILPPTLRQPLELAALFFALWGVMIASPLSSALMPTTATADAGSTFALLRRQYGAFGPEAAEEANPARLLAGALRNTIPLVYGTSATALMAAMAWQSQFARIAEMQVCWSELPEFELAQMPQEPALAAIVLRDPRGDTFAGNRLDILKHSLGQIACHEISMDGNSALERLWGAIYLADWAAFYLAP